MQLQLNINDIKANLFLELLEVFKKDKIVENYRIIENSNKKNLNNYEKELINDLKNLNSSIKEDGYKTNKFIEINDLK